MVHISPAKGVANMADQTSERNVPISRGGGRQLPALPTGFTDLFRSLFGVPVARSWLWPETIMGMDAGMLPATDVVESDKEYRITAELPGIDPKDISVTMSEGSIVIKGEKSEERREDKKGYFRQERSYGQFQRVIALPPNFADETKAEAAMNKGVLTITVPKKAEAQTRSRRLDIRQGESGAQGSSQGMRQGEMRQGEMPRDDMRSEGRQDEGRDYGRAYGREGRGDYERERGEPGREQGRGEPGRDYRR